MQAPTLAAQSANSPAQQAALRYTLSLECHKVATFFQRFFDATRQEPNTKSMTHTQLKERRTLAQLCMHNYHILCRSYA